MHIPLDHYGNNLFLRLFMCFFYKIKFHDFFDFWTFINVLFYNTLTFYEKTMKYGYFHF